MLRQTPNPSPASLRGLVLAGGRSSRLGCDKAAIVLAGRSFLERCVDLLRPVVGEVQVAVRSDQIEEPLRSCFPLLADAYPDIGPAGGLLAAHRSASMAAWLVLACDMPGVTAAMLHQLVVRRNPDRGATAFRSVVDGRPEPLCAIYEPATLALLQARVETGGPSGLRELLATVNPILLDAPGADTLASINTPEDLGRVLPSVCPGGTETE